MISTFGGMRVIEDRSMVNVVEDWSRVRSPSRALRRRRQGHRQNIDFRHVPKPDVYKIGDTLVMHPETRKELMRLTAERKP